MATQDQKSNIITLGRQLAQDTITILNRMDAFNNRYTAGGYSSLTDADFIGENEGITAAQFSAWALAIQGLINTWQSGSNDTTAEGVVI